MGCQCWSKWTIWEGLIGPTSKNTICHILKQDLIPKSIFELLFCLLQTLKLSKLIVVESNSLKEDTGFIAWLNGLTGIILCTLNSLFCTKAKILCDLRETQMPIYLALIGLWAKRTYLTLPHDQCSSDAVSSIFS